jgi:hypothetical protein
MFLSNWKRWFSFLNPTRKQPIRKSAPKSSYRPMVDEMEERVVPSGGCQVAVQCGPSVVQCGSASNTNYQSSQSTQNCNYQISLCGSSQGQNNQGNNCGQNQGNQGQGGSSGQNQNQGNNCGQGQGGQGSSCGQTDQGNNCGQGQGNQGQGGSCGQTNQGNNCGQGQRNQGQGGGCGQVVPDIISGVVYLDAAKTGVYATTDAGLPGVSVTLTGTNYLNQAVSVTVPSGTGGAYSFTGVLPGTYAITYGAPSGDTTEAPASTELPAGATAIAGQISNIVLTSGNSVTVNLPDVQNTVIQTGSISGTVKYETVGGSTTSEVLIAGVTVQLLNSSGTVVATAVTDANGAYTFGSVPLGSYTVQVDTANFPATVRAGFNPVSVQTDMLTAAALAATNNFTITYAPGA